MYNRKPGMVLLATADQFAGESPRWHEHYKASPDKSRSLSRLMEYTSREKVPLYNIGGNPEAVEELGMKHIDFGEIFYYGDLKWAGKILDKYPAFAEDLGRIGEGVILVGGAHLFLKKPNMGIVRRIKNRRDGSIHWGGCIAFPVKFAKMYGDLFARDISIVLDTRITLILSSKGIEERPYLVTDTDFRPSGIPLECFAPGGHLSDCIMKPTDIISFV